MSENLFKKGEAARALAVERVLKISVHALHESEQGEDALVKQSEDMLEDFVSFLVLLILFAVDEDCNEFRD